MFLALLGNLMDLAFAPFVGIAYLLTGTKMLLGVELPRGGETMLSQKTSFLMANLAFLKSSHEQLLVPVNIVFLVVLVVCWLVGLLICSHHLRDIKLTDFWVFSPDPCIQ